VLFVSSERAVKGRGVGFDLPFLLFDDGGIPARGIFLGFHIFADCPDENGINHQLFRIDVDSSHHN
jgi:hypothetical protein